MAESTLIEWADSTFNPWIGCTKIAPACDHCYAAEWARRYRGKDDLWGKGPRQRTSESAWREPLKWQRGAAAFLAEHGRRRRVFCASLADVFDNQVPSEWRDGLWALILACPDLDWLLLTKRPQNIEKMLPAFWDEVKGHVWLGTTVEDQDHADRNIPHLLKHDSAVRFISVEPMLGSIDLEPWLEWPESADDFGCQSCDLEPGEGCAACPLDRAVFIEDIGPLDADGVPKWALADRAVLNWVIAGGESGNPFQSRPSHPDWFRALRDQCAAAGVPFLFKQWGNWICAPEGMSQAEAFRWAAANKLGRPSPPAGGGWGTSGAGAPTAFQNLPGGRFAFHAPKSRTGRELDGKVHNEFPEVTR